MTPKEKAKHLYNTFYSTNVHPNSVQVRHEIAIEFAIKCIDEILDKDGYNNDYWKEVKEELKKI